MYNYERFESEVRSYCRSFPTVFCKAKDHLLWDIEGKEYIDFFAGAGALNYGHNNSFLKEKLIEYIVGDGITHSLDMATMAKETFLGKFYEVILAPRRMNYKIMFPGPTGTNTVESALKIARKVTGRTSVISFTNAFHGMSLGSLSMTANPGKRRGAGVPLEYCIRMPYDRFLGDSESSLAFMRKFLQDKGSGIDLPAAMILETVQGEGGLNAASFYWLREVEKIGRELGILLIIDDVQAGCGRTGTFFSFEPAGIQPDIICLSKLISGYGLPMSLTLIKPEYDIWSPGEHNGTFRGNNAAFVTAAAALTYWEDRTFQEQIQQKAERVHRKLTQMIADYPELRGEVRGRGLMQGIACGVDGLAENICKSAFRRGVILETSGPRDEVVKLLPPLTITEEVLDQGLQVLEESIQECLNNELHVA
ncbi:diaminobutyrate--2-oxoglutarate transaminase [Lihuaxuella thermophila]|uniref:Diaminobutyrate--2-oxoglutarate transaminase n=1 Tax=Lihuaxuella thermophila TaxID=1173111 RepID=A0A1H8C4D3_9BACL|nr:diaminobutyrate--2-oxoglutarate transaminase [Lihuaxuella thermophila]SEM89709.1 diaminobutyrate-2-oxoglutarate transaminase [Lihuaxuella thermophila]